MGNESVHDLLVLVRWGEIKGVMELIPYPQWKKILKLKIYLGKPTVTFLVFVILSPKPEIRQPEPFEIGPYAK